MIQNAKIAVQLAREQNMFLVIDADGLFMVQNDPNIIKGYPKAVLTPNVVEFGRLCQAMVRPLFIVRVPRTNVKSAIEYSQGRTSRIFGC
jgi:NAD(P)H-hydrate repair Nnr-like enzyme with NAD(P)H-hydrate dehydratase domain